MNRLTELKNETVSSVLFDRQYAYNAASQINQIVEPSLTRNFTYDDINRLKQVQNPTTASETYAYDGVGNRTSSHLSSSYTHQANNKLTADANNSYGYDANGNLTSKTTGSNSWTYVWDYENRLTEVINPSSQNVTYEYDALGRRTKRTENTNVTKFTYDGMDVVLDDDTSTGITKYQNGLGIDNKLKLTNGATAKYFLQDHLGSTNALTDASGAVISSASYDSFGNSINTLGTRHQFTGREKDDFSGLTYYRARWYDSNTGRFISEDPIGLNGGINQFGYVNNNPLMFRDPSGEIPVLIPIAIGAGILILTSPSYINAPAPGDRVYTPQDNLVANGVMGLAGGLALRYAGGAILSKIVCKTGGSAISEGAETVAKTAFSSVDELPPVKSGFTRVYRGSGHPDIPQVSPSMRGVAPNKVPSGATNFATQAEAQQAAQNTAYQMSSDVVSASRSFTGGSFYKNGGGVIVYDIPTKSVFNNLPRPLGGANLEEVVFKYSIPELYRVGIIR